MEKVCAGEERARIAAPHTLLLRCSWHCSVNLRVWTSVACVGLWVLGLGPRSSVLFFFFPLWEQHKGFTPVNCSIYWLCCLPLGLRGDASFCPVSVAAEPFKLALY